MDYTNLSLPDVRKGLAELTRETQAIFSGLSAAQLNWRPDATRWSVAQCFDHLLRGNAAMLQAADDTLNAPPTLWQRMPVVPRILGRLLIQSQSPDATRRFTAPPGAQPASSEIAADVIQRFLAQHHDAMARLGALDERVAARTVMTSPFIRVVTYSVLDGWRLILAHDRRHIEQAHRVARSPGFPGS